MTKCAAHPAAACIFDVKGIYDAAYDMGLTIAEETRNAFPLLRYRAGARLRAFIASVVALSLSTSIAAAAPSAPPASAVQHLEHRMRLLLQDIAHKNEQAEVTLQPDKSGLRTIVRVKVHPSYANQLRGDLTKKVNEYIAIHKGDCRADTRMKGASTYALNPIANGVSTTELDVPLSTLMGHGNVITTRTADGTIINCGSF